MSHSVPFTSAMFHYRSPLLSFVSMVFARHLGLARSSQVIVAFQQRNSICYTGTQMRSMVGLRQRSTLSQDEDKSGGNEKVSVAIVGSGAVGSYYGARLWECEGLYDVKFHIRSKENYDACTREGLYVKVSVRRPDCVIFDTYLN
jgi:hypothetical protein